MPTHVERYLDRLEVMARLDGVIRGCNERAKETTLYGPLRENAEKLGGYVPGIQTLEQVTAFALVLLKSVLNGDQWEFSSFDGDRERSHKGSTAAVFRHASEFKLPKVVQ